MNKIEYTVKPTNEKLCINGCSLKISEYTFEYDKISIIKDGGMTYVECFLGSELEDRFLVI